MFEENYPEVMVLPLETAHILETLEPAIEGMQYLSSQVELIDDFLEDNEYEESRARFELGLYMLEDLIAADDIMTPESAEQWCEKEINRYDELSLKNERTVVDAMRTQEQNHRAIHECFIDIDPVVKESDQLLFFDIDPQRFLDGSDNTFFDFLAKNLTDRIKEWDVTSSPNFIVTVNDIVKTKAQAKRLAELGMNTSAIVLSDFRPLKTLQSTLTHAKKVQFGGPEPAWGFMAMAGNWAIGRGAYSSLGEKEGLPIPTAVQILGKWLSSKPSNLPANSLGILNITDIQYQTNRKDDEDFNKYGLFSLSKVKGDIKAFGGYTLNRSNNPDLKFLNKVRVANLLDKSLVDFTNSRAYDAFDLNVGNEMKAEIAEMLNFAKKEKIIADYDDGSIEVYQEDGRPEQVNINVKIAYFEPSVYFLISLESIKDKVTTMRKQKLN